MNIKISIFLILFFFLLAELKLVSASNTVSISINTYFYINASTYNLTLKKNTGEETQIYLNGRNVFAGQKNRASRFYNSTGQYKEWYSVGTGAFLNSYEIVENGPARVVIKWSNSSLTDAATLTKGNFSRIAYFYPTFYIIKDTWFYLENVSQVAQVDRYAFGLWNLGLDSKPDFVTVVDANGTIIRKQLLSGFSQDQIRDKFHFINFFANDTNYNETANYFALDWLEKSSNANRTQVWDDSAKWEGGGYLGTLPYSVSCPSSDEITWGAYFGNKGGIGGPNPSDSDYQTAISDVLPFIQDKYYVATVETIAGSYQQFNNETLTYNFTTSFNRIDFNFTLGNYNRSYPVFLIRNLNNVAAIKDHVWWRNYTGENNWIQLTNYTDFIIQEGNSTYFGYDYILLMLNYTLINTSQTYEIWVSNETDPDYIPPSYSLNSTNSTLAGSAVEHRLKWQDNVGLSGYIFSFDNCTGSFVNDSWTPFNDSWSTMSFKKIAEDNFDNTAVNTIPSGWTSSGSGTPTGINTTNITYRSPNNSLEVWTGNGRQIAWNDSNPSYTNYGVEVWVNSTQLTALRGVGLFLRLTGSNYYDGSFYFAEIESDNVRVSYKPPNSWDDYTLASASDTFESNKWYHLRFEAVGDKLSFYVNGTLKLTAINGSLTSGKGGIFTFLGLDQFAYYDDFLIYNVTEAWSNVTKTINSTVGCTIRWCVYANDTSNNWNSTSCENPFSYVTTPAFLINLNAGGPYVKNISLPTVLIVGNVSWFYGDPVDSGNVSITIYEGNTPKAYQELTTSKTGRFSTSFNTLDVGSYVVNISVNHSLYSHSALTTFKIVESLDNCVEKTVVLNGTARDYMTGQTISSGTAKVFIKENNDKFTTSFTGGKWSAAFVSCLLPDQRHTAIVQITDSVNSRVSWKKIQFRV